MHRRPEFARVRAALARSFHFNALSGDDLDHLAEICHLRRLRSGALAGAPGDKHADLWFVLSGGLRLGGATASGEEFVYAVLGPGSYYGLAHVLEDSNAIVEARAHGATELAVMNGRSLLTLLDRTPRLWRHMCKLVTRRLSLAMSVIRGLSVAPLRERIAQRLLGQAMSGGAPAAELSVTQTDLCRMLGCSRSKLNAELKALEKDGLLRLAYRTIILLDSQRLAQMAGPDVFAF